MTHNLDSSDQSTLQANRVDAVPSIEERIPLSKIYEPLSFPVIALLMSPAVFGVLARLGLVALMTYNGESVFPLAYIQALGCLIMGFCLRFKEPLGQLYVQLHLMEQHINFTDYHHWQLSAFLYCIDNRYFQTSNTR